MQVHLDYTSCHANRPITLYWLFFSCVLFYSLWEMCCYFMTFGLLLLLSVRSIWGYFVCDGVPGLAWLVAPLSPLICIFIDMFAPKWARGPHNLARFPSWDPCITPGYWAWYLNALPTSGSLIRSLFYAFMPREGTYICVFCSPSSPQERKRGYAALLRIRGNYVRPYLSIPRVCHWGAPYQWKFSYCR